MFLWKFILKNHPQVYLEQCKYRVKKIQMSKFINIELKSDSDSDSELDSENIEAKCDAELMAKLTSGSGSEWDIIAHKWSQMITNKNDSHK